MDIFQELFESPIKVRALKLFLRNPTEAFSLKEGSGRLGAPRKEFAKQLKKFTAIGLVRVRTVRRMVPRGKKRPRKVTEQMFHVNSSFPLYQELRELILNSSPTSWGKKLEALKRCGRVKLAIIAGVLVNDQKGRVDMLIVGDKLKGRSLAAFVRSVDADVGAQLRYATLTSQEFTYSYGMYDNFIRDMLERPHKKIINKMKKVLGD